MLLNTPLDKSKSNQAPELARSRDYYTGIEVGWVELAKVRYFRAVLPPHHAVRAAAFGARALGLDGRATESASFAPPTIPMATL